ncbi:TPA: hypothetical protein ACW0IK_002093 [Klebsiella variicola]
MDNKKTEAEDDLVTKINDGLKIAIQLTPIAIILSCILLWVYLHEIYRLDLFMPSLKNPSNVIPVFLSFMYYISYQALPSTPFFLILIINKRKNEKTKITTSQFLFYFILSFFGFALFIFFVNRLSTHIIFINTNKSYILIALTLLTFITLALTSIKKNRSKISNKIFIFTLLSISICIFYTLNDDIINSYDGEYLSSLFFIFFSILLYTFCSLSPSVYIVTSLIDDKKPDFKTLFMILALAIILPMLFSPNILSRAIQKTMINIGISNWCVNVYRLSKNDYAPILFPQKYWFTRTRKEDKDHFFINATAPFSLGEKTLVCPSYIRDIYDQRLVLNADSTYKRREIKNHFINQTFQQCFVLKADEIDRSNTTFFNILNEREMKDTSNCPY